MVLVLMPIPMGVLIDMTSSRLRDDRCLAIRLSPVVAYGVFRNALPGA